VLGRRRVGEAILSAVAVGSPQLLQRSPAARLIRIPLPSAEALHRDRFADCFPDRLVDQVDVVDVFLVNA
jgi:hypothetical protein